MHDVPAAVYALLRELGRRVSQPLTVIVERDGCYPPIGVLLAQLDRARDALAEGRAGRHRSSPRLEGFLARLYTDQALLEAFLRQPERRRHARPA